MSLRHAIVGLLAEEPMSGYDLASRFAVSFANVWPAQHPQIYSELARLVERGWIRQTGQGPRGRKIYAPTEQGLLELRSWLTDSDPGRTLRHEPILRAFLRWTVDPAEAADQFRADAAAYRATLAGLEELARSQEWEALPADRAARLALEAGLRIYRTLGEWADWAAARSECDPA